MRRALLTVLVAATLSTVAASTARATEVGYGRKFGLGFVLGDPTGLSGKVWLGPTNALDFGLGFAGYGWGGGRCWTDPNGNTRCDRWGGYGNWSVNVDYLWQSNIVRGGAQLDWHIGVGGRAVFWGGDCYGDCAAFGVRAPIGLDLMFNNPGFLEVFFEIAPAFYFVPGAFGFEGGLGVRFYF